MPEGHALIRIVPNMHRRLRDPETHIADRVPPTPALVMLPTQHKKSTAQL